MTNRPKDRILHLLKDIPTLPDQDRKNVIEFAENSEWGLALDALAHQIYEYQIKINRETFDEIVAIGKSMDINPVTWDFLKRQII